MTNRDMFKVTTIGIVGLLFVTNPSLIGIVIAGAIGKHILETSVKRRTK